MSGTRKRALAYLQKVVGEVSVKLVSSSKFYEPKESFTTRQAWWFDLPIGRIQAAPDEQYYLACDYPPKEFIVLKVPNRFFIENLGRFDTKSENILRLHLAAYPEKWLVDERVENGIDFSQFEIK